tara:strand:- start:244 stop:498 length:255 start_codon:yes stop_codon:yes gene_type:complete
MSMSIGDLVNFKSHAWIFKTAEKDYVNPGVILNLKKKVFFPKNPKSEALPIRYVAEVMWADGKITSEHCSYLTSAESKTYGSRK